MVKANELLKIWLKSCDIILKSVNVLGSLYLLMDGSDLDDLCQWVNSKRTVCCDKEITIENLLEPIETKDSTPILKDGMAQSLVDFHENVSESSHDIPIGIVEDKQAKIPLKFTGAAIHSWKQSTSD